jgi:hypothetical protein
MLYLRRMIFFTKFLSSSLFIEAMYNNSISLKMMDPETILHFPNLLYSIEETLQSSMPMFTVLSCYLILECYHHNMTNFLASWIRTSEIVCFSVLFRLFS